MKSSLHKTLAKMWILCIVCAVCFLGYTSVVPGLPIEGSVLKLLPNEPVPKGFEKMVARQTDRMGRQLAFVITDHNNSGKSLYDCADSLVRRLSASTLFVEIQERQIDDMSSEYYRTFFPHRAHLLSESLRAHLLNGSYEEAAEEVLDKLYDPFAPYSSALLKEDPLLLFTSYVEELNRPQSSFTLQKGYLVREDSLGKHLLITAELDSFALSRGAMAIVDEIEQSLEGLLIWRDLSVTWSGIPKFSAESERVARFEITLFGTVSTVALILLALFAFRTWQPLLLGMLPTGIGFVFAMTGTLLFFGELHVLTLVFGTTLLGVTVDYSFHYLCSHYWSGQERDTQLGTVRRIFRGVTLGMFTSILGYLVLVMAPFEGLQQIALFSSLGLVGAYVTVLLLFPYIPWGKSRKGAPLLAGYILSFSGLPLFTKRWGMIVLIGVIALGIGALRYVEIDDDIRLLRSSLPQLDREEAYLSQLGLNQEKSRMIVVAGNSPQEVSRREYTLMKMLDTLAGDGVLEGALSASSFIPPITIQKENYHLLQKFISSPAVEPIFELLGTTEERCLQNYQPQSVLTLEDLKPSPLRALYQPFRPTPADSLHYGMILLHKVKNPTVLKERLKAHASAWYSDRVDTVSSLFRLYRTQATKMVIGAYILILIGLIWRYGIKRALRIFAPPVASASVVLMTFALLGIPLQIFSLLALLLVLAMGIDYTLFLTESESHTEVAAYAIVLSALTTLIAFGLLGLSSTPALKTLGGALFLGVIVALLLSPLAYTIKEDVK